MPTAELLLLAAWCAVASVTQSVSGFGFGVVLVAVLPLFGIEIQRVVVLVTLLVMVNIAIALWRVRRHANLRRVAWVLVGVPFGIPFGLALLTAGPGWEWALRGLLGAVLVFAALEPVFLRGAKPAPETRRWALFAGFCSGLLGGALSTGGPPVVVYYVRRRWPKEETKAAVMAVFVGTVAMRVVSYVLKGGLITAGRLREAALLLPVVVVASLLGERLFRAISQRGFRIAIAAVIAASGAYQLCKAAHLLMEG